MTTRAAELAANVVPPGLKITSAEREIILEIAFLAVAADSKLSDEELFALSRIAARLAGKDGPIPTEELDEIIARFAKWRDRKEVEERLQQLGAKLSPAARSLAYRVAYVLAMCDLESSDEEFEFDLQLIDALELTAEQTTQLAKEVHEVLQG
jgi:hypothetical protein